MRQTHKTGEKCFVGYAGQRLPLVCPETGEIREAQIFVALVDASNYTYAEASLSQSLPDWLGSHVRAFEYFGSTTAIVVLDFVPGSKIRDVAFRHPAKGPESMVMGIEIISWLCCR